MYIVTGKLVVIPHNIAGRHHFAIKVYKLLTSTKSYSGKPINDKELLKYLKIGVTEYFVRNYKGEA